MRWKCWTAAVALAAAMANPASAQDAAQQAPEPTAPVEAPVARPLTEGVVATVNDEIISSYDLRQRLLLLIATSGIKVNEQNLPALQQEALRSLVDEHLQMQELRKYDVKVSDAEIDEEIAQMARQNNISAEQLIAGLRGVGVDPSTLRNQIRASQGWQMLVSGRYSSRARVGRDQVEQTIQRISAATAKPQYLVGEIYIDSAVAGGMEAATNAAAQLVDQIVKGAPFQAVARQFSSAPSGPSGGDAGWLISGEMAPEIEAALANMQSGQLSRPIPSKDGVWIVYLREKRAGGGSTMVSLKQAAVRLPQDAQAGQVEAAQRKLAALQPRLNCQNIEEVGGKTEGVVAADLGESNLTDLAPEFRQAAEGLQQGQVSQPIRTAVGVHLLAVCNKRVLGANIPTREEVENRLFVQQISMLARRYMRDLQNAATIEVR